MSANGDSMNSLPNFLIIGTAKAGTTSLMSILAQHPDVFFPDRAETNFFAFDKYFDQGIEAYKAKFEPGKDKLALGEKSWRYSVRNVYPRALPRIVQCLPKHLRLIYLTRNPLERMESLWLDFRSSGQEIVSSEFNTAIRENPIFVDSCKYWSQINAFRQFYPDQQILMLFFEDFVNDIQSTTKRCLDFLGVKDLPSSESTPRNASRDKRFDSAAVDAMRKIPGFNQLRDWIPAFVRRPLRKMLKKDYQGRPQWNNATKSWAMEQVAADAAEILEFNGKPPDYWRLT